MPYDVRVTRLEPPQTLIAALFAACRRVPFTGDALASVWDASAVWANRCDEPVEEVRVCRTTITAIPAFSSDLEEALREALGMAAELLPIVDDRGKSWLVLNALRPAEVVERTSWTPMPSAEAFEVCGSFGATSRPGRASTPQA